MAGSVEHDDVPVTMAQAAEAAVAAVAAAAVDGDAVVPTARKKLHGRAFYESIGSPRFVLAPMVDQSEFVRPPES